MELKTKDMYCGYLVLITLSCILICVNYMINSKKEGLFYKKSLLKDVKLFKHFQNEVSFATIYYKVIN